MLFFFRAEVAKDFDLYLKINGSISYNDDLKKRSKASKTGLQTGLHTQFDKNQMAQNEKTLVFTRVFNVARPRVELGTLGL